MADERLPIRTLTAAAAASRTGQDGGNLLAISVPDEDITRVGPDLAGVSVMHVKVCKDCCTRSPDSWIYDVNTMQRSMQRTFPSQSSGLAAILLTAQAQTPTFILTTSADAPVAQGTCTPPSPAHSVAMADERLSPHSTPLTQLPLPAAPRHSGYTASPLAANGANQENLSGRS